MSQLNCNGKYLALSHPQVMGILNITPNSFSTVGRFLSAKAALAHAEQMVIEGAAIIDIGGEPTNPSVHPIVSLQEELDRVIPVVELLARHIPIPISVDTSKPEVMHEAIACGASFINDVRALQNPDALKVVAETQVPICLMHMAFPDGMPTAMTRDVMSTVKNFLQTRIDACLAAGITREKIVIDPGIGGGNFGKNMSQNLHLLAQLRELKTFNLPLLIGVSRKLFIGELLNIPIEQRLYGSLGAAVIAVNNGANIIRTHDVKPTVEAIKVAVAISSVK